MLPEPLLRQVRRLTLKARRAAREQLVGHYESAIHGAGLTFAEVRPYQPGDDVRHIDWNVTARTGSPHIKRFVEERERTVWLVVDVSGSQEFGKGQRTTKRRAAAEVAALVAFAAAAQRDRVGLVQFTDGVEQVLLPMKGDRHARRVVRELFAFRPIGRGTSLATALAVIRRKRRAVVFLASDFRDRGWERPVRVAARRHDLIAVVVSDPDEAELPDVGLVRFADAESGGEVLINTGDSRVRAAYATAARERREVVNGMLRAAGADRVDVSTAGGHLESLVALFRRRERRR